jgi:molybdopterin converting factor subunit 1
MIVKVLYFGRLKELCCAAEESVDLREGAAIEELFSQCSARNPALREYRSSVVAARNQEFAAWDTPLRAGDEIGFLPPVSGG